jgi:hypothetical protein
MVCQAIFKESHHCLLGSLTPLSWHRAAARRAEDIPAIEC